jgi:hypothetical protein
LRDEGIRRQFRRNEYPFEARSQAYKIETLQVETNIKGESEGRNRQDVRAWCYRTYGRIRMDQSYAGVGKEARRDQDLCRFDKIELCLPTRSFSYPIYR